MTAPEDDATSSSMPRPGPVRRAIGSFTPRAMAPFARRNYRYELCGVAFWPVAVTMIEWGVTGTIAEKAFPDTPGWVLAVLTGAPAYSNITSSIWTRLVDGRRTVRNLVALQIGVLAMIAVIAVCPISPTGLYLFTAAAVAARMLMAGVVTLRSVLWRSNYLRRERARVTGKLITIQTLLISSVTLALGAVMDVNPNSFRVIYPLALLCGLIGVMSFARIRIRRPFQLLSAAESTRRRSSDRSAGRAVRDWVATVGDMIGVLRRDAAFRGFMICMFVMGISNLALSAPLVRMLDNQFGVGYLGSLLLLQAGPFALIPFAIPLWARLLDRVHVIRFRVIHSWFFVAGHLLLFAGALSGQIAFVAAGQLVRGVAMGGGALAWNIGHNDFAAREEAGLYMSVHVTLTGVRGVIGSVLGILIYTGEFGPLRAPALGAWSFLFWAAVCTVGALGFAYLNWKLRDITGREPEND